MGRGWRSRQEEPGSPDWGGIDGRLRGAGMGEGLAAPATPRTAWRSAAGDISPRAKH